MYQNFSPNVVNGSNHKFLLIGVLLLKMRANAVPTFKQKLVATTISLLIPSCTIESTPNMFCLYLLACIFRRC